jgi:PAS domain S-box-containing protein/putative nucleotidyltransferase with HDIG domain
LGNMENIPLYNSRIIKNYIEYVSVKYPHIPTGSLLAYAGISNYELEDQGHWLTQKQVDLFHEILSRESGDPNISREVGRFSTSSQALGLLRQYTMRFMLPAVAYSLMEKIANYLNRSITLKTEKLGSNKIEATVTSLKGFKEKPYVCENRIGMMESLAKVFTRKYARVEHPVCMHKGGDHCLYIISWEKTPAFMWKRSRNYLLLLGLMIFPALHFMFPGISWIFVILFCTIFVLGVSLYSEYLENRNLSLSIEAQGNAAERLLDQIDIRYNEALMVKEIGQATSMILDIDSLLKFVVETLEKRLDFDRGMIMLANKERNLLVYTVGYGYNPEHEGYLRATKFHLDRSDSKGPVVLAFKKQIPFLVSNISEIEGHLSESSIEFARRMRTESFICVPIIYEKESMGVLLVDNLRSKRHLSQSDISLLLGVAPQIAISLKNAISYEMIREREERFRSLSENAPDIIYTLGTDGAFTYVNPAWERIMGYSTQDVIGKYFVNFAKKEDIRNYVRLFKIVRDERRTVRDEIGTLIHKDGSDRYFSLSGAPNLDAAGNVTGIVGTFKDITDLKRSQEELERSFLKLKGTLDVTIQAISMIVEARDPYTSGHQERVARLSSAIAAEMGLSEDAIMGIRMAALLHDIGKINVPAEILSKPTRLNEIEFGMIRTHPRVGYNILKTIGFPFSVEKIVLQHHERMDGSGYPAGLSGDDIILEARILAVSDVVESMASHRPYRPALGVDAALAEISQKKGVFFDPLVVDACVKVFHEKEFKF